VTTLNPRPKERLRVFCNSCRWLNERNNRDVSAAILAQVAAFEWKYSTDTPVQAILHKRRICKYNWALKVGFQKTPLAKPTTLEYTRPHAIYGRAYRKLNLSK